MKIGKAVSVEELQIVSRYESLRKMLLSDAYQEHLDRPLAYWALPTDRRLPLAFLGRTLRDLLNVSFDDLAATPGIGRKKIVSFVQLLARAANTDPADLPIQVFEGRIHDASQAAVVENATPEVFDPTNITEVTWAQWRANVVRQGLEKEVIGRFAPSLQNMTRVIWNTPLDAYTNLTLAEIRSMKTHGEKRVRALLEVFHAIYVITAGMGKREHLVVHIVPRLVDQAEQWARRTLQRPGIPNEQEIFENYVQPLLEQIRTDATQQIAALAENRLGIGCAITSVRQAARSMGLTRARVYQLLNEINDIMVVRWPMGRHLSHELREKFESEASQMDAFPDLRQFSAAIELFYPGSRRGAAGPMEQAADILEHEDELVEVS